MSRFNALEISFSAIRELRDLLPSIRMRSAHLARQIEKAAASIALNLGEGSRRSGRDRLHHYRIAAGSADEVRCALKVAEALGYISTNRIARCLQLLDGVLAILWSITIFLGHYYGIRFGSGNVYIHDAVTVAEGGQVGIHNQDPDAVFEVRRARDRALCGPWRSSSMRTSTGLAIAGD